MQNAIISGHPTTPQPNALSIVSGRAMSCVIGHSTGFLQHHAGPAAPVSRPGSDGPPTDPPVLRCRIIRSRRQVPQDLEANQSGSHSTATRPIPRDKAVAVEFRQQHHLQTPRERETARAMTPKSVVQPSPSKK